MSNVVEFAEKSRPAVWRSRHIDRLVLEAGKVPCEIVIFPGVRYERWTGDSDVPRGPTPTPAPAPTPASATNAAATGKKRRRRKA